MGGSCLGLCLWAKISTGMLMVQNNLIKNNIINMLRQWYIKKEGELSPVLEVAASLDCGGGGMGNGFGLCLWAEIPLNHSYVG